MDHFEEKIAKNIPIFLSKFKRVRIQFNYSGSGFDRVKKSRSDRIYCTWGSPGRDEDCPIRGGEMTAAS
jgi:hypothetical protein